MASIPYSISVLFMSGKADPWCRFLVINLQTSPKDSSPRYHNHMVISSGYFCLIVPEHFFNGNQSFEEKYECMQFTELTGWKKRCFAIFSVTFSFGDLRLIMIKWSAHWHEELKKKKKILCYDNFLPLSTNSLDEVYSNIGKWTFDISWWKFLLSFFYWYMYCNMKNWEEYSPKPLATFQNYWEMHLGN